jgi:hypothetical protein
VITTYILIKEIKHIISSIIKFLTCGCDLRLGQDVDELGILENVTRGGGEEGQNLILDFSQFSLGSGGFDDQIDSCLFDLGVLLRHDDTEHTVGQTGEGGREISGNEEVVEVLIEVNLELVHKVEFGIGLEENHIILSWNFILESAFNIRFILTPQPWP